MVYSSLFMPVRVVARSRVLSEVGSGRYLAEDSLDLSIDHGGMSSVCLLQLGDSEEKPIPVRLMGTKDEAKKI